MGISPQQPLGSNCLNCPSVGQPQIEFQHVTTSTSQDDQQRSLNYCLHMLHFSGFLIERSFSAEFHTKVPGKVRPPLTLFSLWPLIIKPLNEWRWWGCHWVILVYWIHILSLFQFLDYLHVENATGSDVCNMQRLWTRIFGCSEKKKLFPQNSQQLADLLADQQLSTSPFPVATIPIFHRTL